MLDNLRGMAVFASVVRHASFSGAAKELGITTSAVSQQIRSLENDMGVVLLHRSTRKLSYPVAVLPFLWHPFFFIFNIYLSFLTLCIIHGF